MIMFDCYYYLFYTKLIFIILNKIKNTNYIYVSCVLKLQGSEGSLTCIVFIPLLIINIAFNIVKLLLISLSHKFGKAFLYFVQAY
jgi:hypothetical protein